MKIKKILIIPILGLSSLFADATVSSYNCGGLKDHYDYLRAVAMQKVASERYNEESSEMAEYERIQSLYLKILFSTDSSELAAALSLWKENNYDNLYEKLTTSPKEAGSINAKWFECVDNAITPYNVRPIVINDSEINEILHNHLLDLTKGQNITLSDENSLNDWLDITRKIMAERIFKHQLKYDIIALQEADYLTPSMFPDHFEVYIPDQQYSVNGLAWNRNKFSFIKELGSIKSKGIVVELLDNESGEIVAIASGHLSGCNPFNIEGQDSEKGDGELHKLLDYLEESAATIKIIAMDSNVTAKHPRMEILKNRGYSLDYKNYLDGTCTSPHQVINTRIDWIAVKLTQKDALIENIPVLGVHLNSAQTNISDHRPIAAKIIY
jgi:hypothetical protein